MSNPIKARLSNDDATGGKVPLISYVDPMTRQATCTIGNTSFAQGFHPSTQEISNVVQCLEQPHTTKSKPSNIKSKTHRKRHIPVGPAGVWFQTQQQQQQHEKQHHLRKQSSNSSHLSKKDNRGEIENNDDDEDNPCTQFDNTTNRHLTKCNGNAASAAQSFHSLAWTAVQCSLGYVTPNLPAGLSPSQKYSLIRRHVPNQFVLIREISSNMLCDWKLPMGKKLLVMVHSMKAVMGDNYLWTVGLTDETGSYIQAWIEPSFVQKEQQCPVPQYLRLGVVWMLTDVTLSVGRRENRMMSLSGESPDDDNDDDDDSDDDGTEIGTYDMDKEMFGTIDIGDGYHLAKSIERTILISESNIEQVWTSASEKEISNEKYIQWFEQRTNATLMATTPSELLNTTDYPEANEDNHHRKVRSHLSRNLENFTGNSRLLAEEELLSSSTDEQEFRADDSNDDNTNNESINETYKPVTSHGRSTTHSDSNVENIPLSTPHPGISSLRRNELLPMLDIDHPSSQSLTESVKQMHQHDSNNTIPVVFDTTRTRETSEEIIYVDQATTDAVVQRRSSQDFHVHNNLLQCGKSPNTDDGLQSTCKNVAPTNKHGISLPAQPLLKPQGKLDNDIHTADRLPPTFPVSQHQAVIAKENLSNNLFPCTSSSPCTTKSSMCEQRNCNDSCEPLTTNNNNKKQITIEVPSVSTTSPSYRINCTNNHNKRLRSSAQPEPSRLWSCPDSMLMAMFDEEDDDDDL